MTRRDAWLLAPVAAALLCVACDSDHGPAGVGPSAGAIQLSQSNLFLNGTAGSSGTVIDSVVVTRAGGDTLGPLSIGNLEYPTTTRTFLSAEIAATPIRAVVRVAANLTGLSSGQYTAVVPISSGEELYRVTVTLGVQDAPQIMLGADSIRFFGALGAQTPGGQGVDVTSTRSVPVEDLVVDGINYAGGASGWLEATLDRLATPAVLTVTPRPAVHALGTFMATITVRSNRESTTPRQLVVTLAMGPPGSQAVRESLAGALRSLGDVTAARAVKQTLDSLFTAVPPDEALVAYVAGRSEAVRGIPATTLDAWASTWGQVSLQSDVGALRRPNSGALTSATDDARRVVLYYLNGINSSPTDNDAVVKALTSMVMAPRPFGLLGWTTSGYRVGRIDNPTAGYFGVLDLAESVRNILAKYQLISSTAIALTTADEINRAMEQERRQVLVLAHSQGNLILLEALRHIKRPECLGVVSVATPQTSGWPSADRTPSEGFVASTPGGLLPFEDIITALPTFGTPPPGFVLAPTPLGEAMLLGRAVPPTAIPSPLERLELHKMADHYLMPGRGDVTGLLTMLGDVDRAVARSCGQIVASPTDLTFAVGESTDLQLYVEGPGGSRSIDSIEVKPAGVVQYVNGPVTILRVTGLQQGTASLTAYSGPLKVTVPILVTAAPVLQLSPPMLTFTAEQGAAAVGAQQVTVTNAGAGSLGVVTTDTVQYGPGGSGWLSATVSNGASSASITLNANVAGISPGQYTAQLPVLAQSASNSPQLLQVTLSISAATSSRWTFRDPYATYTLVLQQGPAGGVTAMTCGGGPGCDLQWSGTFSGGQLSLSYQSTISGNSGSCFPSSASILGSLSADGTSMQGTGVTTYSGAPIPWTWTATRNP